MTDNTGSLAEAAYATLHADFDRLGHRPGVEHTKALKAILTTLKDMAEGTAEAKVYLSAVDPGVGKTKAMSHAARALVASAEHRHVGMLIMVGRITEAVALAGELQDIITSVAIATSDDAANALGKAPSPEDAQVLIITQQRAQILLRDRSLADVNTLRYLGAVREVRVWDESYFPGYTLVLESDDLLGLLKSLRLPFPELRAAIRAFADELDAAEHGEPIQLPDFENIAGPTLYEKMDHLGMTEEQSATLLDLLAASGTMVRAVKDGKHGIKLVSYIDSWPADFMPLLVLDASGRVRHTYRDMEQHRQTIVRLPVAAKDYGPLTVHMWQTPGGKHAFEGREQRAKLLQGVADLIASKPNERWLVVAHKSGKGRDSVAKSLRKLLPGVVIAEDLVDDNSAATVGVIHWGRHMSRNDYKDVPNVILAGTFFLPDSGNYAMTHLAQGVPVADGLRPGAEMLATKAGESAHHILQALCRGRVRQLDGDCCKPMEAYIIASGRSGIAELIPDILPGCKVAVWRKDERRVPAKVTKALAFLDRSAAAGIAKVTYGDIQTAAGVTKENFSREVTKQPEWPSSIESRGWRTYGDRRSRGLVLAVGHVDSLAA